MFDAVNKLNDGLKALGEKYLEGLNWPATKEELIAKAIENKTPEGVLNQLRAFQLKDGKRYNSLSEITKADKYNKAQGTTTQ
ncbi:DUF2795 domain-containing protein [Pendulispora brunnea]|uniref:DUF2795 domain-containing protein n=1 Tax=Pendulispora brunnea TaxID=2905690 RepID=A0ABZ2KAR2_9BACT